MTEHEKNTEPDADELTEGHLSADLEQTWQDESPTTAAATDIADEVDGELGTRPKETP